MHVTGVVCSAGLAAAKDGAETKSRSKGAPGMPPRMDQALTVIVLAALVMTAWTTSAQAAGPSFATDGKFCAYRSDTKQIACTDSESSYDAAKASIGLAPSAASSAASAAASTQYLLGRFFDLTNQRTDDGYIDFFGNATCTSSLTDVDASWTDTTNWRSRISSYHGYSSCWIKAYQNTNFSGTSRGYEASTNSVGSLNDHIWSVRFS